MLFYRGKSATISGSGIIKTIFLSGRPVVVNYYRPFIYTVGARS